MANGTFDPVASALPDHVRTHLRERNGFHDDLLMFRALFLFPFAFVVLPFAYASALVQAAQDECE